jgi:hypothetical protein
MGENLANDALVLIAKWLQILSDSGHEQIDIVVRQEVIGIFNGVSLTIQFWFYCFGFLLSVKNIDWGCLRTGRSR